MFVALSVNRWYVSHTENESWSYNRFTPSHFLSASAVTHILCAGALTGVRDAQIFDPHFMSRSDQHTISSTNIFFHFFLLKMGQ